MRALGGLGYIFVFVAILSYVDFFYDFLICPGRRKDVGKTRKTPIGEPSGTHLTPGRRQGGYAGFSRPAVIMPPVDNSAVSSNNTTGGGRRHGPAALL